MISYKYIYKCVLSLVALCACCSFGSLRAQTVAVRTNAMFWAVEAANVSVDLTINECTTLGVTGVYSVADAWIKDAHVQGIELEYRYWFSHQPFHRLFMGPMAGIFHYRIDNDVKDQTAVPMGINAGYALTLTDHWNVEASYGLGCLFYKRIDGKSVASHHKFTSLNLGLSIAYVF